MPDPAMIGMATQTRVHVPLFAPSTQLAPGPLPLPDDSPQHQDANGHLHLLAHALYRPCATSTAVTVRRTR